MGLFTKEGRSSCSSFRPDNPQIGGASVSSGLVGEAYAQGVGSHSPGEGADLAFSPLVLKLIR